jgi:hypothetical protein
MSEYDPENIADLARQFAEKMGCKTLAEARLALEDAVKRSDGKMLETYQAMLTIVTAAQELEEDE